MEKEMKIYHVETQEDYDDLMIKLEEQGYKWMSGDKPTINPQYWDTFKENTYITLDKKSKGLAYGDMGLADINYPDMPINKHKVKGVN